MLRARLIGSFSNTKRCYAVAKNLNKTQLRNRIRKYPVGKNVHEFEINEVQSFPELDLVGVLLEHKHTGAKHLHMDSPNNNNVFSVAFKTNPPDSTGVPHILEHTTLCGSEKYPVKDPFFKMLNRSLSNFMNAMTAHDYTYYPFSTTNEKDFGNLIDVYLDCTLHPMLRFRDFLREGWRIENKDVNDKNSPMEFKGVVYNEMKGQMSNSQYKFYMGYRQNIYPSLNNSGGDPKYITDLSYDDLFDFHLMKYHPSNMKSFSFGNFKLESILEKVHKSMSGYGRIPQNSASDNKQPLTLDQRSVIVNDTSAIDPMLPPDKQFSQSVTWSLNSPQEDLLMNMKFSILSKIILDNTNSPFYKKFIETGEAIQYTPNTGYDCVTNKNFFNIGFEGIDKKKYNEFQLEKELKSIWRHDVIENADSLFEEKKIEGIVNQIELKLKHQKANFGMSLLNNILPLWMNKVDPMEIMNFNDRIEDFKMEFDEKGSKMFTELVEEYFLNNNVFVYANQGVENYNKELEIEEANKLKRLVSKLSDEDKDMIFERNLHFDKENKDEGDIEKLPSLEIEDINKNGFVFDLEKSFVDKAEVYKRITSTNGITYIKTQILDLEKYIDKSLLSYLSLYVMSLTTLGSKEQEYHEIEDEINLELGGVQFDIDTVSVYDNMGESGLVFELQGWGLNAKSMKIFEYWKKILEESEFSSEKTNKMKALIKSLASNTSSFSESGHNVARSYAASRINKSYALDEYLSNIENTKFINELNEKLSNVELTPAAEKDFFEREVFAPLKEINEIILSLIKNGESKIIVHTDNSKHASNLAEGFSKNFVDIINCSSSLNNNRSLDMNTLVDGNKKSSKTIISFPFQVSHTSKLVECCPYNNKDSAALQILANILTTKVLHPEIRERNGAYGGGATYSSVTGLFNFYSYRDPNPLKTLKFVEELCSREKLELNITKDDLKGAKLSIFQGIDAPVSPMNEGMSEFEYGLDKAAKEQRRAALLSCTVEDVNQVFEKYLHGQKDQFHECIVGNEENFETQNFEIIQPYLKHN
ncbi:related to Mitochondrial presequence protease [Hanseniaspora guilliermondii]|uniref:Presequence protease, mitochondrial n=1 Tax=Hanseniaspora guilliermondii TaxID=56406 RepID=A0A1L0CL78_9ASCO|nr:related to Mitochondrial presequence protease [Hanseniaspora guilliermondii]